MVDMSVAQRAYAQAKKMGASDKVLLALFEAGLVESNFTNEVGGDRDSVGFLQQRPSQGWGTKEQILNVEHATSSFVSRASLRTLVPGSAGQLAQSVQRSAFPLRYDQREAEAKQLIAQMAGVSSSPAMTPVVSTQDASLTDSYDELKSFFTERHGVRRLLLIGAGWILLSVGISMMFGKEISQVVKEVT